MSTLEMLLSLLTRYKTRTHFNSKMSLLRLLFPCMLSHKWNAALKCLLFRRATGFTQMVFSHILALIQVLVKLVLVTGAGHI